MKGLGWLQKLGHRFGRRGVVLLFFGLLWISSGQSWVAEPPRETDNYVVIEQVVSFWALGWMVTIIGNMMLVATLWKRLEDFAFGLSASIASFLGLGVLACYLPGVPGPAPAAPRVIAIYFTYCLLVLVVSGWPEATRQLPPKDKDQGGD